MPNATVKYLCEFFFTNFWHWLALLLLCASAFGWLGNIIRSEKNG